MKRIFDIIIATLVLTISLPIFLIIGLIIWINDKGPAIFKQERVGKNGKIFLLYKFRSMRDSNISHKTNFEPGNISRVTSVGKFLRKTKLDEFPQFINVLIGNMSIVGPRPEVEKWVKMYPQRWKKILTVKPGLTDYASIIYRNEEYILGSSENPEETYKEIVLPRKLELYEYYIENQSFLGDIKLIFKTFSLLFFSKQLMK
jgi:lipopolysaccharide/colanic/teichoic acid biosynthesis glycosyltransferase